MVRTTTVVESEATWKFAAGIGGVVVVLLVTAIPAQVNWTRQPVLEGRSKHAMAYDRARARMVLFGGNLGTAGFHDTWEWAGASWSLRTLSVQPPAGLEYAMAYDSARGRCVLVGAYSSTTVTAATWEFDGTAWVDRTSLPSPSWRDSPVVAYDEARGRVVLFGGYRNGGYFSDTWEWDGTAWTLRSPAASPPARAWHRMAWDPVRGRVVLFGGEWYPGGGSWFTMFADTWEWDGTNWSRLAAAGPPGRRSHALAFDALRGRMVLTGGEDRNTSTTFADTWEWQGNSWILRTATAPPPARTEIAMAYDATLGRVLLFGGRAGSTVFSDTWTWDGLGWARSTSAGSSPAARPHHALAQDPTRQRIVLFGGLAGSTGLADTWEWDGNAWLERTPAAPQRGNAYHAMAYDAARARVVRFGGFDPNGSVPLGDTSEWDGTNWVLRAPTTSPSPRYSHAMAYDSARGRTVMFGGGWPLLADTWEWDGTSWVLQSPSQSPSARQGHAMAYDPDRGRVVLFGGEALFLDLADTWEWDGTNWLARSPATSPPAREFHGMTYDAARRRVVLFGGRYNSNYLRGDTWEWDGTDWSQRAPASAPTMRFGLSLAYDSTRAKVVLYGGYQGGSETWTYGPTIAAEAEPFGQACAGSAGSPAHTARDLPWLGDAALLRTAPLPAPAVGFLFLGFDRTQWNGVPLPFDLTPLGMTGCALRVAVALALVAGDPGGALSWSVPVGNTSDLLGVSFFTQSLHVDTPANPFGATTSNGLRLRIGGR